MNLERAGARFSTICPLGRGRWGSRSGARCGPLRLVFGREMSLHIRLHACCAVHAESAAPSPATTLRGSLWAGLPAFRLQMLHSVGLLPSFHGCLSSRPPPDESVAGPAGRLWSERRRPWGGGEPVSVFRSPSPRPLRLSLHCRASEAGEGASREHKRGLVTTVTSRRRDETRSDCTTRRQCDSRHRGCGLGSALSSFRCSGSGQHAAPSRGC